MRSIQDFISSRARAVDASGIRKVFDLAAKMKDPINLSIGLPDFDVPALAKNAAIDAIQRGENQYTLSQGIAPLRTRLRKDLSSEMGRDVGEVMVTSGVAGGLYLAILALLDPGEEAVFVDPYFVMYKHMVTMAGGVAKIVDCYPDFRFPADNIERAITPRTKVMILSSPSNPTGLLLTESDIRAAVDIAKRHDLLILSDEIYEPFRYDGLKQALYSPGQIYDRTLVLRGFGKSHGMTGWRIGYACGPQDLLQEMIKFHQYTYICAPSPLQWGALAALDVSMDNEITAYQRKRDIVFEKLSRRFELTKPNGAFYAFPAAPKGLTGTQFVHKAIENNVLVIPGNVFSERDTHFRVSYATTDDKLAAGCEILCSLV